MSLTPSAPWHKLSFERFLKDRLPQLLADRLPLAAYSVESSGRYSCRVALSLATAAGSVELIYNELPQPDDQGIFELEGSRWSVVPLASSEELEHAEIRCVGELLY